MDEEVRLVVVGGDLMMRAARAKERAERERPRRMRRRATSGVGVSLMPCTLTAAFVREKDPSRRARESWILL